MQAKKAGFNVRSNVSSGIAYDRGITPGVMQSGMWQSPDGSNEILFPDVVLSGSDPQYPNAAYGTVLGEDGGLVGVFQYKWGQNAHAWSIAHVGAQFVSGNTPLTGANGADSQNTAMLHYTGFHSI